MKKSLFLILISVNLNAFNPAVQQSVQYLVQYSDKASQAISSILTIFVGIKGLEDIKSRDKEFNIYTTVPLTAYPEAERKVMDRINVDEQSARQCINKVMFGIEYKRFDKWTDDLNKATHACYHNYANPLLYLTNTRSTYDKVKTTASFQNTWNILQNRVDINRDNRLLGLTRTRNPKIITSFPSSRKLRLRGGLAVKKYREELGWN